MKRHQETHSSTIAREQQALVLAAKLPDLMIEAKQISATIAHGIHGRRRAGPGETFWQFRTYEQTDSATLIDWRRTASSNSVFVRETEWEAAHTIWLWSDLSRSMDFQSHLSTTRKDERAIILMLALTELLVRGGERVGLLGLTRPTASRRTTARLAQELALNASDPLLTCGLPPNSSLPRHSGAVLFSDFLDPLSDIEKRLRTLACEGVTGHLVQVLDPAEETLPYDGRVEFIASEGSDTWITERAQSVRDDYRKKLGSHRDGLREIAHNLGWSLLIHHTDHPATEPLLALIMHMKSGSNATWTHFARPQNTTGNQASDSDPAKANTKTGRERP